MDPPLPPAEQRSAGPRAEAPRPKATPGPRTRRPAPARHRSEATGWARPRAAGIELRRRPDPSLEPTLSVGLARVAGRVIGVRWGADGEVWVRILLPDRRGGWAPGTHLLPAPAPEALSRATVAAIARSRAGLGRGSSVVVRDALGRTLLEEGTRAPLVLASVTKLATMAAALDRFPVDRRTAADVLGSSNNSRAQGLSNRLGRGSGAAGARATIGALGALGADWRLVDGSGLLAGNQASGAEVADLLVAVRERPWFPLYLRSLPLAGRSGTLAGRMTTGPARARVRAKTGTLFTPAVSTLAGYAWPAGMGLSPRRALVVVILSNGRDRVAVRPHQDAIMRALTTRGALVPARGERLRAGAPR